MSAFAPTSTPIVGSSRMSSGGRRPPSSGPARPSADCRRKASRPAHRRSAVLIENRARAPHGVRALWRRAEQAPARRVARRGRVHIEVLAHREIGGDALFGAPARDEADPARHRLRRVWRREVAHRRGAPGRDVSGDLAEDRACRSCDGPRRAGPRARASRPRRRENVDRPTAPRDTALSTRERSALAAPDGLGESVAQRTADDHAHESVHAVVAAIASVATRRPSRSTVTRSAMRKTSSSRWVT